MNMKPETMAKRIVDNINKEYCSKCFRHVKCVEECDDKYCQLYYEAMDLIESLNKGNVEYYEADGALAFLHGYTGKDRKFFLKKA